jgi:hypothetical protein
VNLEQALAAHLISSVTCVNERVYPLEIPQNAPLPCITYQRISTPRQYVMGNDHAVANPRMQIDCWGATYASAKEVAASVLTALNEETGSIGCTGKTFNILVCLADSESDSYEQDGGKYRVRIDFRIMYEE